MISRNILVASSDSKHWLRNRPQLLAMVVRFNTLGPSSLHPDHAPAWLQREDVQHIAATARGRRRISNYLNDCLELDAPEFYDFQPWHRRFALLEFPILDRLSLFTASTLLSPFVSRMVGQEEVRQAKQALGEELFGFAVKRARFIATDRSGVPVPTDISTAAIRQLGWRQIECCLAGESPQLIERLNWKLPLELRLTHEHKAGSGKERIAELMRKLLITEVQPELASCFE